MDENYCKFFVLVLPKIFATQNLYLPPVGFGQSVHGIENFKKNGTLTHYAIPGPDLPATIAAFASAIHTSETHQVCA